jgi:hypothetical protein
MSNTGSSSSTNANNTHAIDPEYVQELADVHTSSYWLPSGSKLSRGKKGTVQRMFTGEPLKNLCNVYIYNETTKDWKHEHTITGDPSRTGTTLYPPSRLTSATQTVSGITYTITDSVTGPSDGPDAHVIIGDLDGGSHWWTDNDGWTNSSFVYNYPNNQPTGWSGGTWVPGTYVGSNSLGGVSGEWIKVQTSVGLQPTVIMFTESYISMYDKYKNLTVLGSNDNTNWTNLGNFVYNNPNEDSSWTHNLSINTTYTYFGIVFKDRTVDPSGSFDINEQCITIYGLLFTASGPSEDFGKSLDGTDNADMVAVGAPGTWFGTVSNINGYARVFTKNSNNNGWTQRGSEVSQQGGFGHSVALSQYDGNILVVGAPFYNTLIPDNSGGITFNSIPVSEGKVYIYKWNGANYILQQTLNSPSGTLSNSQQPPNFNNYTPATWQSFYFGYSLGITDIGDKIIVGEPAIRNTWSLWDQVQGEIGNINSFQYTGNAHVYHNHTVLNNGTNWTSNVSMTSVIGTTGIGLTDDTHPTKVRWMDALGVSVDINRAGTRILAGGPGSYGTSNTAPHAMSGRIYTLDWDQIDGEWKEMGEIAKHIVAPQANMMLGWSARFDGSGRRIISGAPGFKWQSRQGNVIIFDWNGDQWVSFPNEMVDITGGWTSLHYYYVDYAHALGESVSVDGEGEMVAIGKNEHHHSIHGSYLGNGGVSGNRPNGFTVPDITYIGGATTTVAGSDSQLLTGMSNIWAYNINQSMVVKGNVTVGGFIQGTGISIGTNDDSSTSNKSIYFGGSKSDNAYELTVIENRVYEGDEKAELLLFKGNDNADATGGGTYGPDRIRLKGGQIAFDVSTGYDRTHEDIRAVIYKHPQTLGGMLGINNLSPSESIDVIGKIKCNNGFIGRGTELSGINLDWANNQTSAKFGISGATRSSSTWGTYQLGASTVFPTLALTSNSSSGYTVSASTSVLNAWRAFDDVHDQWNNSWSPGNNTLYNWGYIGTTEKVSGYKGEWIEIQLPNKIFVEKLDIGVGYSPHKPRISYTFGSNDGVNYNLIYDTGDKGENWGGTGYTQTVFTRTPDINNEDPYDRILFIVNEISPIGLNTTQINYTNIDIHGKIGTWTPTMILDNSGKIGILNTTPSYPLDVAGDINMSTGSSFRINGVAQTFGGGGGGSSLWTAGTGSYSTTINRDSNVGISNTAPDHKLSVAGDIFSSSSSGFIGYGGNLSGISIQGERNNTIINFGIGSNTQSAYANPD